MSKTKIRLAPSPLLTQTVLVDSQIEQMSLSEGLIEPFEPDCLSGCSYDLRAGGVLRSRTRLGSFDLNTNSYIVESGECITVESFEKVNLAAPLMFAVIANKHSVLAKGIFHPITTVDPGFRGHLALTFIHSGSVRFKISRGDKIAKIYFSPIAPMPKNIYGVTQRPSYSEGSTDIALIVDQPQMLEEDALLAPVYGRPVARLYERIDNIEKNMGILEFKRKGEAGRKRKELFWAIVLSVLSGISGSLVTIYWDPIYKWMVELFK